MTIKPRYLLSIFLMCLSLCSPLAAQERRTVLLNTHTNRTDTLAYKFENNLTIPLTVRKKGAKLHVWLHTNQLGETQIQYVNLKKKNSYNSIGQGKIIKGTASLKIPLNIHNEWNQEDTVKLIELKDSFTTAYPKEKIIFNNSDNSSPYYSLSKQPKLVVDYEVPKETYGSEWSQLNGNAQHTNRIDWLLDDESDDTNPFSYEAKEIYKDSKKSLKYISIYKNKPLIFGKNGNNTPFVAMLTGELGNKELWRLPLNALPDKQPVIRPDGKMVFVSEKNVLEILDLNKVESIKSIPLSEIKISLSKNEPQTINSVADEMTLGYDGTIYMPITNQDGKIGIVALTAYPSLKPRWFYNTTNAVGPVSLSDNERMAFFLETDRTSKKSRLVVLDNINGAVLTQSKDILGSYTNDGNSYIPSVVLQAFDKDSTAVYVLDGYKTSNKLYVFKINYEAFFDTSGVQKNITELEYAHLIESKNSGNICLSKPTVFNNEKIFFMRDNVVNFYSIKTDTEQEIKVFNKAESNNSDVQIYAPKTNGTDVYFLALYGNKMMYSIFQKNRNGSQYELSNPIAINYKSGNLVKVAMLPNLGICTLDNNETLHYYYVKSMSDKTYITEIKDKHAYLKNQIYIKPMTVTKKIQSIIVGKEIRIASGFTVQKGAELTFQIRK